MGKYYVVAVTARRSLVRAVIADATLEGACRQFLQHPARRGSFCGHVLRRGDTGNRLTVTECKRVVQSQLIRESIDPRAAWDRLGIAA